MANQMNSAVSMLFFFALGACDNSVPLASTLEIKEKLATAKHPAKTTTNDAFQQGIKRLYEAETRYEIPKAIELLEKAVAAEQDNAKTRLALIYAYTKLSKYDKAAEHLGAANDYRAQLSPKESLWLDALQAVVKDDIVLAIERWQILLADNPRDRWAWYELAVSYAGLEEYQKVATAAARALEVEPASHKWNSSWLYYIYSKALYRSGQYTRAVEVAEAGRSNTSAWRAIFYRKVIAQAKAEPCSDMDAFAAEYRRISAEEGRNNASYTEANIALLYFELGDFANASKYAKLAWSMERGSYQFWAVVYSLTENGETEAAVAFAEAEGNTYNQDAWSVAATGWAYYRGGQVDKALQAVQMAKSLSKRDSHHINHHVKVVTEAAANPATPPAPLLPWLG